jgi:hypothetical protein
VAEKIKIGAKTINANKPNILAICFTEDPPLVDNNMDIFVYNIIKCRESARTFCIKMGELAKKFHQERIPDGAFGYKTLSGNMLL